MERRRPVRLAAARQASPQYAASAGNTRSICVGYRSNRCTCIGASHRRRCAQCSANASSANGESRKRRRQPASCCISSTRCSFVTSSIMVMNLTSWLIEYVFSAVKRTLGDEVRSRRRDLSNSREQVLDVERDEASGFVQLTLSWNKRKERRMTAPGH